MYQEADRRSDINHDQSMLCNLATYVCWLHYLWKGASLSSTQLEEILILLLVTLLEWRIAVAIVAQWQSTGGHNQLS